jgi:hypothetical protein
MKSRGRLDMKLQTFLNWALHYVKVKAIPLQARRGPEGSNRLRLPDFKTIGTEGNIPGAHFR